MHSAGFRSCAFRGTFRSQYRNGSIPPESIVPGMAIWQGPLPNFIPLESAGMTGFRQESVGQGKDLHICWWFWEECLCWETGRRFWCVQDACCRFYAQIWTWCMKLFFTHLICVLYAAAPDGSLVGALNQWWVISTLLLHTCLLTFLLFQLTPDANLWLKHNSQVF